MSMPKKLSDKHMNVALMDALGMTSADIAQATGFTAEYIRELRRDSSYKKAVQAASNRLRESNLGKAMDAMANVMDVIGEAVAVKIEVMRTGDPRLRNQAATELLKIGLGGMNENKGDNEGAVAHLHMDIGTEQDDAAEPFFSPESERSLSEDDNVITLGAIGYAGDA